MYRLITLRQLITLLAMRQTLRFLFLTLLGSRTIAVRLHGTGVRLDAIVNPSLVSMVRQSTALAKGTEEGIRISPIEELSEEHSVPDRVLVEMNIEGAEIALFEQAAAWRGRAQPGFVEIHSERGAAMIDRAIAQYGFNLQVLVEKTLGLHAPWTSYSPTS